MEEVNVLWFVGSLAFLVGMIVGALLYHLMAGSRSGKSQLESQLTELETEFKDYQDKVSDHFNTTAHLINKLTDSYKDVYEHMANSADALCEDDGVKNRLSDTLVSSSAILSGEIPKRRTERTKPLAQPLDYAPKKEAEAKGTLAEGFGVKTESEEAVKDKAL